MAPAPLSAIQELSTWYVENNDITRAVEGLAAQTRIVIDLDR